MLSTKLWGATQKQNNIFKMSNLGNLWFSLGLDDSKFKDGIKAAKKAVEELNGKIDIDMSPVTKAIQDVEEDTHRLNRTLKNSLKLNFGVDDLQRTLDLE